MPVVKACRLAGGCSRAAQAPHGHTVGEQTSAPPRFPAARRRAAKLTRPGGLATIAATQPTAKRGVGSGSGGSSLAVCKVAAMP